MFKHEKQLFHPVSVERIKVVYENLYRQIDDKMIKETIDFPLNRKAAHNAMFREAFNQVQETGSNKDFGTNRASSMYFSMSGPSPRTDFPVKDVKPVSFEK